MGRSDRNHKTRRGQVVHGCMSKDVDTIEQLESEPQLGLDHHQPLVLIEDAERKGLMNEGNVHEAYSDRSNDGKATFQRWMEVEKDGGGDHSCPDSRSAGTFRKSLHDTKVRILKGNAPIGTQDRFDRTSITACRRILKGEIEIVIRADNDGWMLDLSFGRQTEDRDQERSDQSPDHRCRMEHGND